MFILEINTRLLPLVLIVLQTQRLWRHLRCSLQNALLLPILLIHWKVNWRMTNNDGSSARWYVLAPTGLQHKNCLPPTQEILSNCCMNPEDLVWIKKLHIGIVELFGHWHSLQSFSSFNNIFFICDEKGVNIYLCVYTKIVTIKTNWSNGQTSRSTKRVKNCRYLVIIMTFATKETRM